MKLNGCVHSPCLCTLPVSTLIPRESISTLCGQYGSFWAEARRPFALSANSTIPLITLLLFQEQRRKRKVLGEIERLGPLLSDLPFLSQEQFIDSRFIERAATLMSLWVESDRMTVFRLLLRIAYFVGMYEWFTNDFDFAKPRKIKGWMAWSPVPGQNIEDICKVFEPAIANLGVHLQHQDDLAAYKLIPALEWLESRGWLSGFGVGLLKGLKETESQGKSPRPPR